MLMTLINPFTDGQTCKPPEKHTPQQIALVMHTQAPTRLSHASLNTPSMRGITYTQPCGGPWLSLPWPLLRTYAYPLTISGPLQLSTLKTVQTLWDGWAVRDPLKTMERDFLVPNGCLRRFPITLTPTQCVECSSKLPDSVLGAPGMS